MSLINRLATQTSSGYKSFISLFKYKLLLMALLLGATSSVNALHAQGALNIGGEAGTKDADHPIKLDVAATEVTNTIPHSKNDNFQLTDSLISHVGSLSTSPNDTIDANKSVLYIGVMKDKDGGVYGVDEYKTSSNLFNIDVASNQSNSLGVLLKSDYTLGLKSIEVYPKLGKGLKFGNSIAANTSVLTLKNGLNIHKDAVVAGLEIDGANLTYKGNVSNYGKIKVAANAEAVEIGGAGFVAANPFTLTNETDGVIEGKITRTAAVTTAKGKFKLINNGEINITATAKDIDIDDYSGSGRITVSGILATGIVANSEPIQVANADFKDVGNIVLKTSISLTTKITNDIYIVKATKAITGFSEDQLMCQLSVNNNKGYIISSGEVSKTDTSIAVTDATATVLDTVDYFPTDPIKLSKVNYHITNAPKKAKIIDAASKTEFAGIKFSDAKTIIDKVAKDGTPLKTALNDADADDYPDILMPDSSNSTLNVSSKITSKVFDHIGSRIASRNINFSHKKGVTAVNSGEVADNLSMWSSVGYAGSSQKKTDDNQDYSDLSGFVFNVGLDTNLNNDMIIGGCYGFSNNTATIHGAHNKTEKAENKVMSHIFSGYASFNFDHVADANFAVMFGMSKNDYSEVGGINDDKYDSTMFGFNAGVVYPVEVKQHSIDILGQLGVVIVNSKEHNNKYGKTTPKQSNTLINLGLGSAFKDTTVVGDDMPLHYSLGVMMKLALTTGDEKSTIVFDAKTPANNLKVKNRKADMFSINCNTGLNLQARKNLDVNFDFDFGLGFAPLTVSYGIGAGLRYKF